MGYITLPNVDEIMQQKDPKQQMEMLVNTVGLLMKSLSEINGYLTTSNIKELHAKVIKAGTVTAEKMDVDELSAITANMGKLTSGEIYGAYIATKEAVYPRAEMSNSGNQFIVYLNANDYIKTNPSASGLPGFEFYSGGVRKSIVSVDIGGNDFGFLSHVNAFISASGYIRLNPASVVLVDSFAKLAAGSTSSYETLDSAFASNMAFDPVSRNLKLYSKSGVTLATVNIP